jgi:hypothetical protein
MRHLVVKSGLERFGPGLAKGGERSGDERLAIHGDFKALAARGSDAGGEEAVFAREFFNF